MSNDINRDGLTGNSGLGVHGYFHVSANYAAGENTCFVSIEDAEYGPIWQRMPIAQAIIEDADIIKCHHCNKPAISLDHHWPYDDYFNYCAGHRPKRL